VNRSLRTILRPAVALAIAAAAMPAAADAPVLAGTTWQLAAMDNEEIAPDAGIGIAFGRDGRVGGSGGCNRFGGGFTQAGESVSFTPLMATRMMCPNGVSDREQAFLSALEGTLLTGFRDGILVLRPQGEAPVLTFRRAQAQ
jgi:heat shock protein HslJ